jgi:acetyltransferase-like isoleucine patch superfamily enzyme
MKLSDYLFSYLKFNRYKKSVSFFSVWDGDTKLGKNVYIAFGVRLGCCDIGEYTRVRHFSTVYHATIGKFSTISKNVRIGIGQHPTNLISTNLIFYKRNLITNKWVRPIKFEEYKPISIGNDVWVGESAMVMGGVKIGDGAVIAAHSVVTRDVPPYAIVAGVPAKVVKYRFDEEIINSLLDIKWWNLTEQEIEDRIEAFTIFNIPKTELYKHFLR